MPYTKRVIFGTDVRVNGRNKGATGPYRPESGYSVGISWGTFTMFKGEEDPQAVKTFQLPHGIATMKARPMRQSSFLSLTTQMTGSQGIRGTFMLVALVSAAALCGAEPGNLRVGAAKVDISPPASFFPYMQCGMKLPPDRTRGAVVGVHDPLYARAIVVDNGSNRVALVVIDNLLVPKPQELSKLVTTDLGIPPEHLMLAATHLHNNADLPFLGRPAEVTNWTPYYDVIKAGVVEAARQAKAHLQPARMGFGTGKAYVNVNRDEPYVVGNRNELLDHRYGLGANPDRPSDKTVAVLKFESLSGDPIAILINYAVHAVVLMSARTKGEQREVSADLPGATCRLVEEFYKNKPVAVWTSGAAGDQNPQYMVAHGRPGLPGFDMGAAGYAVLEVQSRRLAEEAFLVATAVQATTSKAHLWGGRKTVSWPGQRMTRVRNTWKYTTEEAPPVDISLSMLVLGDIALAGVGGEPVTVIGQQFRRLARFRSR